MRFFPILKRYIAFNRALCPLGIAAMLMILAQSGLNAFARVKTGDLIDDITSGRNHVLLPMILVIVGVQLVIFVLNYFSNLGTRRLLEDSTRRMRDYTFERISTSRMSWLEGAQTGDIVSRVNGDLNDLAGKLNGLLSYRLPDFVFFAVSLGVCIWLDWKLSLLSFTLIPLLGFLQGLTGKPIAALEKKRAEADGQAVALAANLIGGLAIAKAFHLGDSLKRKFDAHVDEAARVGVKSFMTEFAMNPLQTLMMFVPRLLITGMGVYFVLRGEMTAGGLIAFLTLADNVTGPINGLSWTIRNIYGTVGIAARVFDVWDVEVEDDRGTQTRPAPGAAPVAFRGIHFAYAGKEKLFNGLSFTVNAGERVAIVGTSGAGKSTLLKLIARFYDAADGEIDLFGHRERDWELAALRSHIAYVNQEALLFPGSIRENVLMGKPDATGEELADVLRAARIDDLDIDVPIGERGVRLSGGQRQRVCIARAMLKGAQLILLDEPTSALDTESEYLVTQALEALTHGRTTLIVAHRLSAIRQADRILCIDGGRVAEQGTHAGLMEAGGLYRRLYENQTEEAAV